MIAGFYIFMFFPSYLQDAQGYCLHCALPDLSREVMVNYPVYTAAVHSKEGHTHGSLSLTLSKSPSLRPTSF